MKCAICGKPLDEHSFTDFTEHILGFDHPDFHKEWIKLIEHANETGEPLRLYVDMGRHGTRRE